MTLDDLMNIRPQVEEGARVLFASQGLSAYTRQNAPQTFQDLRPRIEIRCKIGSTTGHRFVATPGTLYNDAWYFEMALRCVSEPQNVEADNLINDQLVSRVRGVMQTFAQESWNDVDTFPNCLIVEPLKDATTDDTLQADDNEEYSILSFSGIVQIRESAWAQAGIINESTVNNN
jgi:hypothetical protein